MSIIKLLSTCNITTGKLDANAAVENGMYPFFTCAPEPLRIDDYAFNDNVILLAGNNASGNFHCQRYNGKFNAYQRTYVLTAKNDYDIDYIYYSLLINLQLFKRMAQGSQTKFLTIDILNDFEINDIPIEYQKSIVYSLVKIDKKIGINQSICFELEAMAKLLYDYWFVQFDFPDENGKPYKSSGGKMVWNEELKREIPDGWSAKKLSKIADIVTTSITTENSSYYLHYSIPAFDENKLPSNDKGDAIDSNKYLVPDNAVLVSKLNPHFQRVWWVGKHRKNSICSTEFMPFVAQTNIYEYLYSLFKSEQFYTFMVNSSSSSTGSRKRMQPDLCLDFMIPYPDDDRIIHSYCSITNPVLQKVSESLKENQQLASLRDFLLPMLMNGQVKVKKEDDNE